MLIPLAEWAVSSEWLCLWIFLCILKKIGNPCVRPPLQQWHMPERCLKDLTKTIIQNRDPYFIVLPDRETVGKNQELAFWVSGCSMTNQVDMNLGWNSLLPRQSSKPSARVNTLPAGPRKSTLQVQRLISACAGNSSKLSFPQFVKMYMKHKAKDRLAWPWKREQAVFL